MSRVPHCNDEFHNKMKIRKTFARRRVRNREKFSELRNDSNNSWIARVWEKRSQTKTLWTINKYAASDFWNSPSYCTDSDSDRFDNLEKYWSWMFLSGNKGWNIISQRASAKPVCTVLCTSGSFSKREGGVRHGRGDGSHPSSATAAESSDNSLQ